MNSLFSRWQIPHVAAQSTLLGFWAMAGSRLSEQRQKGQVLLLLHLLNAGLPFLYRIQVTHLRIRVTHELKGM